MNWCQTYIKSESLLFLYQYVTSHEEERVFNQIFHFFSLGYIRVVLFPAAGKIYKKCQWGITSC